MTLRRLLTAAAVALSSVAWTPTRAALAPPPAPADTDRESRQQWSAATVRHLLRRMRTVPTAQRERAVSALQEHVRLHGHAGLVDDVVAALVEALDDPDPHRHVPRAACDALRDLGPTARAAVPALRRRVAETYVGSSAVSAISHILGRQATPILIEAYHRGGLNDDARQSVRTAFAEHPDLAALNLMTEAFRARPDVFTALYLQRLNHPDSAGHFRWALATLNLPRPGESHDLTENSSVIDVRTIAVQYLGSKRDRASFGPILRAAGADPSIKVRTAATVALGVYGDGRAVDTLAARFAEDREESPGDAYVGNLHREAIAALVRIDTAEALAALYRHAGAYPPRAGGPDGADGVVRQTFTDLPELQQRLVGFWGSDATAEQFAQFLRLYAADPLPDEVAAPVLGEALQRFADCYRLPPSDAAAAAREFYAQVRDPDVVPARAPTPDGEFTIRPTLTLYEGFAIYHARFSRKRLPGDLGGSGYGYAVVYARRAGRWHRVGKVNEWIT